MKIIEVLGVGCPKCVKLYDTVCEEIKALGIDASVTKITELKQIMAYGVINMPGLVIDGKVICSGSVPTKAEIKKLLK
ncbi:MAG: TM0996/MTH895 family glutaredoxin-like protein [Caldisericia bacterium]|nr:TM0996/MTH895 family glutaredoxin-like protein [Caldisericia bacterium]